MKKKLTIGIIIFIIIWAILSLFIYFFYENNTSLENKGYSNLEINEIKKYTKNYNVIEKYDYNSQIIEILSSNDYIDEKLENYLQYYKKDMDIPTLIYIVNNNLENYEYSTYLKELINNENFNEKNIERYLQYQNNNIDASKIIYFINNNYDISDNSTIILNFLTKQYFIENNLERYISYYNNNKNLEIDDIISIVNSNIDKTFYVDTVKTDTSKDLLMLVNKFNYLDESYVPDDLVYMDSNYTTNNCRLKSVAYEAFKKMVDSAKEEGLNIYARSGFRSYTDQFSIYNYYVSIDGYDKADTYSARPGFSEHQTGLVVDVIAGRNGTYDEFGSTNEFKWLKENSYKYGFILRYTNENSYITGYKNEPWHYRYVGIDAAKIIYENNLTFDEYYAYYVNR
jgi:D-alanyl-D-alanine carboxypeptidase